MNLITKTKIMAKKKIEKKVVKKAAPKKAAPKPKKVAPKKEAPKKAEEYEVREDSGGFVVTDSEVAEVVQSVAEEAPEAKKWDENVIKEIMIRRGISREEALEVLNTQHI